MNECVRARLVGGLLIAAVLLLSGARSSFATILTLQDPDMDGLAPGFQTTLSELQNEGKLGAVDVLAVMEEGSFDISNRAVNDSNVYGRSSHFGALALPAGTTGDFWSVAHSTETNTHRTAYNTARMRVTFSGDVVDPVFFLDGMQAEQSHITVSHDDGQGGEMAATAFAVDSTGTGVWDTVAQEYTQLIQDEDDTGSAAIQFSGTFGVGDSFIFEYDWITDTQPDIVYELSGFGVAVVPEPSTALLVMMTALAALAWRRRPFARRWLPQAMVVSCVALLPASGASAFSLIFDFSAGTIDDTFQQAPRWSSVSGLSDGIQVGVEPGFATELGATTSEVPLVEQAVVDAFGMWANDALQFDITFGATGVAEGNAVGFEIDLFAVPDSHSIFAGNDAFGATTLDTAFVTDRPLTNGQSFDGHAITGADIFINSDQLPQIAALFGFTTQEKLDGITRLVGHELGHAIGFGHPNSNNPFGLETFYDTDTDPLNVMNIDPDDPWGDLQVSSNRDDEAIMSNRPCGEPFAGPCPALFYTSLQNDDLGGRDVLYPVASTTVPEPSAALLFTTAGMGWMLRRRNRS